MSGLEANLECYFRAIDKFSNLNVSADKYNRTKLLNLQNAMFPKLTEGQYNTPVKPYFIVIKVKDYGIFPVRELEENQKLRVRVRIRKYNFNGNLGYTLNAVSVELLQKLAI